MMNSIPPTPFYFIRHGETDWNAKKMYMGSQNISLNNHGIYQAHCAKKDLGNIPFQSIVSSPLFRAHETARILFESKTITVMDNFKEACWGVIEGQKKDDGSFIQKWRAGEKIEGGETYLQFKQRVTQGLISALQLPTPLCIVAHGGVYWVIQDILKLPFVDIGNCTPIYHQPPEKSNDTWITSSL